MTSMERQTTRRLLLVGFIAFVLAMLILGLRSWEPNECEMHGGVLVAGPGGYGTKCVKEVR